MAPELRFAVLYRMRESFFERKERTWLTMMANRTDSTWNSASQLQERLEGKQIQQIVPASDDEAAARLYRQLNARKCSSYLGDPPNLVNGELPMAEIPTGPES